VLIRLERQKIIKGKEKKARGERRKTNEDTKGVRH
jgi:hypothetical protein